MTLVNDQCALGYLCATRRALTRAQYYLDVDSAEHSHISDLIAQVLIIEDKFGRNDITDVTRT